MVMRLIDALRGGPKKEEQPRQRAIGEGGQITPEDRAALDERALSFFLIPGAIRPIGSGGFKKDTRLNQDESKETPEE